MSRILFATPQQAHLQIDAPLIALHQGERGYTPLNNDTPVEILNPKGCTPEVIESAIAGSMFGWDCPAAQLANQFLNDLERSLERAH